jgi:hypothetical protein
MAENGGGSIVNMASILRDRRLCDIQRLCHRQARPTRTHTQKNYALRYGEEGAGTWSGPESSSTPAHGGAWIHPGLPGWPPNLTLAGRLSYKEVSALRSASSPGFTASFACIPAAATTSWIVRGAVAVVVGGERTNQLRTRLHPADATSRRHPAARDCQSSDLDQRTFGVRWSQTI